MAEIVRFLKTTDVADNLEWLLRLVYKNASLAICLFFL